ncbi:MAG: HAD hydrolase-like protein [Candidatus Heimdallarchaeota archaeon]|nr:HAD hydrolase-like protein [Candidatus Heimdallarchaeota archaeon]
MEEEQIEMPTEEPIKETIEQALTESLEEEQEIEISEDSVEIIKDDTPWLFFDYSGTLVDTVNALSRTYTRFLGKEFPPEKVKSLYKDYPKLGKIALMRKYKFNPFKYMIGGKSKIDEIRKEEFWVGVRSFPGIPEVLLRLQKIVKAKLAIVTHETELEDEVEREKIFQKFGIPITFDGIITDYSNKKEKFDQFIEDRGIVHGICIGDVQFDLDLGKTHGFFTIGVTWGFSSRDELLADYVIDDPRELLQIVMSLMHQIEQKQLHGDPI